jgi:hypothetical protein
MSSDAERLGAFITLSTLAANARFVCARSHIRSGVECALDQTGSIGERTRVKQIDDETNPRVESSYGTCSRSFALPDDVDEKAIRAESQDGVLRVHIPKRSAPKPQ